MRPVHSALNNKFDSAGSLSVIYLRNKSYFEVRNKKGFRKNYIEKTKLKKNYTKINEIL